MTHCIVVQLYKCINFWIHCIIVMYSHLTWVPTSCNATNVLSSDTKSGVLTVNGEGYTLLYTILCQSYRSTLQLITMNEFLLHVYSAW